MIKLIQNNPYRFLGVFSNSPIRERVANANKLKAYIKVGRAVSYPLDMRDLLPVLERTTQGLEIANASLNLPLDQIKHALFWFIEGSMDKVALGHLQVGNIDKCKEILLKRESFSSLINRGILSFIHKEYGDAIGCITKVIHDDTYRDEFVNSIVGEECRIEESELATIFIDALQEEISISELLNLFENFGTSADDDDILRNRAIDAPRNEILNAISEAKDANNSPTAQYNAGVQLMNKTKAALSHLDRLLGTEDMAYQTVVDKLATQILQCGINYYNSSKEEDDVKIDKAFTLQNYASSIAAGRLVKERCAENVAILEKKQRELAPKSVRFYEKKIKEFLVAAIGKPQKSVEAIELVKACAPYLASIKDELGSTHEYYLQISTIVVAAGLSKVIDEFNSMMNDSLKLQLILNREATMNRLRTLFNNAWRAILYMDRLDMEPNFRASRFNDQKSALRSQVSELIDVNQSIRLSMRSDNQEFAACNSISNYQHYLEIFKEGKHAAEAKIAIERLEFNACNSASACNDFITKYPKSKLPIQERLEELTYKEALGSVQKLQAYMSEYPNGVYYDAATRALDLCEYEACKSISDWKKYLATHPNGLYRTQAQDCITEDLMWQECLKSEGKEKYKEYLAKYPHGRHRKEAEKKASACYIATMVYGDYHHPQVVALRKFRDNVLRSSALGRAFISLYYKNSPAWVEKMQNKHLINKLIREVLNVLLKIYNHEY